MSNSSSNGASQPIVATAMPGRRSPVYALG